MQCNVTIEGYELGAWDSVTIVRDACNNTATANPWPGVPFYPGGMSGNSLGDFAVGSSVNNHPLGFNNQTFAFPAPPGPPTGIPAGYYKLCWARRIDTRHVVNATPQEHIVEVGVTERARACGYYSVQVAISAPLGCTIFGCTRGPVS